MTFLYTCSYNRTPARATPKHRSVFLERSAGTCTVSNFTPFTRMLSNVVNNGDACIAYISIH